MKTTFLEFEQPIAELEQRIEELRYVADDSAVDISEEIQRLTKRSQTLTKDIYGKLTPWQVAQVARHAQRPYTLDYVQMLFTHFEELHGDRAFADDASIVGGLARFGNAPCVVIGHQKGRDTKEKILRNFGMPKPEGYRKALRLMKLAEKFSLPVFTFVAAQGARRGAQAVAGEKAQRAGRATPRARYGLWQVQGNGRAVSSSPRSGDFSVPSICAASASPSGSPAGSTPSCCFMY